jgi:hypothetical protein
MGQERDSPAAVVLAHREQPLEAFLDARIIRVASLDKQRHDGARVIRGILVCQDATQVARIRLAGKNELGGFFCLKMLSCESEFLDQEAELAPGFYEPFIDSGMLIYARPRPASIRQLPLEDFQRPWERP